MSTKTKLSPEEAEAIAERCGATLPEGFLVTVVPTGVSGEGPYLTRKELVQRARRIFWKSLRFKAAARKRKKHE